MHLMDQRIPGLAILCLLGMLISAKRGIRVGPG